MGAKVLVPTVTVARNPGVRALAPRAWLRKLINLIVGARRRSKARNHYYEGERLANETRRLEARLKTRYPPPFTF